MNRKIVALLVLVLGGGAVNSAQGFFGYHPFSDPYYYDGYYRPYYRPYYHGYHRYHADDAYQQGLEHGRAQAEQEDTRGPITDSNNMRGDVKGN